MTSAHLVLTIDRATGAIVGVNIWSSAANTCTGAHFHVAPVDWMAEGETHEQACANLRDHLRENSTFWGKVDSPLRRAMDRLAETGEPTIVEGADYG